MEFCSQKWERSLEQKHQIKHQITTGFHNNIYISSLYIYTMVKSLLITL